MKKSSVLDLQNTLITFGHRGMLYMITQELMRFRAKVEIMSRNEENIKKTVDSINQSSNSSNCIGAKL